MGKSNKKRGRGGNQNRSRVPRANVFDKIDMQNESFFAYYKAQNIVIEEEWDAMIDSFRSPLPTSFRVAGSRLIANALNTSIKKNYVPSLSDVVFESERIPPPTQLPWYPDGLAWQFNVPKKVLRKQEEFKKFHSFLVYETDVGNISRQEAVSMIPPLFLKVEPSHKVMDMCAAPGSKTAQLLEALHAQDSATATSMPSGVVVANDSDQKRTYMLIHQSSRLPSPSFLVTNLDASSYPGIKVPQSVNRKAPSSRLEPMLFDRILCDVPCSGDGTLRKNVEIWRKWQPADGNGLHSLQLRILQRGMNMLHRDGRLVYSTCSLNPVENEAVIAEALASNSEFELVDVSHDLPELKRKPGLTKWLVGFDRASPNFFESYEDFKQSPDSSKSNKMTAGHWPPPNSSELHLDRCLRIYPHMQDTGGFFVAVLERKYESKQRTKREADNFEELPEAKKARLENSAGEPTDDAFSASTRTQERLGSTEESNLTGSEEPTTAFKEDPYNYLDPSDSTTETLRKQLRFTSDFPSANVLIRNPLTNSARSLYLTNDLVKTIVQHNDYTRLRITSAGTKVIVKQEAGKDSESQFRILGEGLPVALPFIDKATILTTDLNALKIFLEEHHPLFTAFRAPFQESIASKEYGCQIIRVPAAEIKDPSFMHDLYLPIWRSVVSTSLMVDKKAKSEMSLRLFGTDVTKASKASAPNVKSESQKEKHTQEETIPQPDLDVMITET